MARIQASRPTRAATRCNPRLASSSMTSFSPPGIRPSTISGDRVVPQHLFEVLGLELEILVPRVGQRVVAGDGVEDDHRRLLSLGADPLHLFAEDSPQRVLQVLLAALQMLAESVVDECL